MLSTTLKDAIKTGVKDEIKAAVKPLEEKQNDLIKEQKSMRADQTAQKVLDLEKKLKPKPTNISPIKAHIHPTATHSDSSEDQNDLSMRKSAIDAAKKILGFSNILPSHIQQAVIEHRSDPNDVELAKVNAVRDFLYYEMKVPETEIKRMKIIRTFRPANQPLSNRLYAEFDDEYTVNLINKYVRNLRDSANIHIWIHPSLYERFCDFDTASYIIRKGPGNFKARVKYGETDFILIKKSPSCPSWTKVIPEKLSPFNPTPPGYTNPSLSPPIGRENRSKRKERSPLTSPPSSKTSGVGTNESGLESVEESEATNSLN